MCGADDCLTADKAVEAGSPPRVRSRPGRAAAEIAPPGITSACAEQTGESGAAQTLGRDHLGVCGADTPPPSVPPAIRGSPPRVRSRRPHLLEQVALPGITSACAEQT